MGTRSILETWMSQTGPHRLYQVCFCFKQLLPLRSCLRQELRVVETVFSLCLVPVTYGTHRAIVTGNAQAHPHAQVKQGAAPWVHA